MSWSWHCKYYCAHMHMLLKLLISFNHRGSYQHIMIQTRCKSLMRFIFEDLRKTCVILELACFAFSFGMRMHVGDLMLPLQFKCLFVCWSSHSNYSRLSTKVGLTWGNLFFKQIPAAARCSVPSSVPSSLLCPYWAWNRPETVFMLSCKLKCKSCNYVITL